MSERTITATVEVLTAEVRVLMVGSRQVTLSVARQLDWVSWRDIEAFGRVSGVDPLEVEFIEVGHHVGRVLTVIGRDRRTGALVLAAAALHPRGRRDYEHVHGLAHLPWDFGAWCAWCDAAAELPLIVLAGLR